eukprot:CAMPEP_0206818982 /NCGR_PEP_ID=MMETSP0975-20121206/11078_1 /ASSEMBLY_ACC=CAM_ASM_000399 /TAXON_ID=483370 /ORGANISM="non described non described, Strain CCMP2097" /LENGTH=64 /DNA_ID=CAMNT_0054361201 /DNA_START=220 /DNA_END=411 /DNA_ORIENTATION=-
MAAVVSRSFSAQSTMPTRRKSSAALCKFRGKLPSFASSAFGSTLTIENRRSTFKCTSRTTSPSP